MSILIWWTMAARHDLNAVERERGKRGSALVRSAERNAFLWAVRNNLIAIAREGELGVTLRERAHQLNRLGVKTTTGKLLDAQKLSPALMALGADTNTIKLLHQQAVNAADRFGVDEAEMVDQLWHEWLFHHTRVMVDEGLIFGLSQKNPFRFRPVRPMVWVKKRHPIYRDHRVRSWWYGKRPLLPPQADLVFALFGMFGYIKKKLSASGKVDVYYFP